MGQSGERVLEAHPASFSCFPDSLVALCVDSKLPGRKPRNLFVFSCSLLLISHSLRSPTAEQRNRFDAVWGHMIKESFFLTEMGKNIALQLGITQQGSLRRKF